MKFTSYYSQLVKANGVPHLNSKAHFLLMNIFYVEACMHTLEKLPCEGKSLANKNGELFKLKHKLRDLTQKQSPEELMREVLAPAP